MQHSDHDITDDPPLRQECHLHSRRHLTSLASLRESEREGKEQH